ncbi:MAG: CheY-like chemotaxis protein [Planctomycetota bacterium]|jgi:CheY-like chemotaxis protein
MARILVIDDSCFQRNTLGRILYSEKHEVIYAPNGAMGLEQLKYVEIDAILVDYLMPVMDGLRFLEELCKLEDPPPAALVTADNQPFICTKAAQLGASKFLSKPIKEEELIEAIELLLSEGRAG